MSRAPACFCPAYLFFVFALGESKYRIQGEEGPLGSHEDPRENNTAVGSAVFNFMLYGMLTMALTVYTAHCDGPSHP